MFKVGVVTHVACTIDSTALLAIHAVSLVPPLALTPSTEILKDREFISGRLVGAKLL